MVLFARRGILSVQFVFTACLLLRGCVVPATRPSFQEAGYFSTPPDRAASNYQQRLSVETEKFTIVGASTKIDEGQNSLKHLEQVRAVTSFSRAGQSVGRLLVSTGFWTIDRSKQGGMKESEHRYCECMERATLGLNASIMVYGDQHGLQDMEAIRKDTRMPPFVEANEVSVDTLGPCQNDDVLQHRSKYTNQENVPSVELGCIWNGKVELLKRSAEAHPEYEWYMWLDVCMGHGAIPFPHDGPSPWPSAHALQKLPNDKITVSDSEMQDCESCREGWKYCHCVAGTAFVVPRDLVDALRSDFAQKVDDCLKSFAGVDSGAFVCLSDQVILTKLLLDNPSRFAKSSIGYGAVATSILNFK